MRRILREESGATSVLILFMMIVLVTFGAFAITSANVNVKFSRSASDWTRTYYQMDAKGQAFLFDLDRLLAETRAQNPGDDAYYAALPDALAGDFADKYPGAALSGDADGSVIALNINDDPYNLSVQARITGGGAAARFAVTEWREWQTPSEYIPPAIWDGTITLD